jgi:hypothetical protein
LERSSHGGSDYDSVDCGVGGAEVCGGSGREVGGEALGCDYNTVLWAEEERGEFGGDHNGYHVAWDALQAWVCYQCGESLFEIREVNEIQKILTELDQKQLASPDVQVAA